MLIKAKMSGKLVKIGRPALKEVKAILSNSRDEARRRVLNLYKMWYRQVPYVGNSLFKNKPLLFI